MARVIIFSVISVFICHTENRLLPSTTHELYQESFVVENKQGWHLGKGEVQKVLCLVFCPPMAPEHCLSACFAHLPWHMFAMEIFLFLITWTSA